MRLKREYEVNPLLTQRRETGVNMEYEKLSSAKITIPLFIIAFIIFSFMMSDVLTHNHFLKMIDMSSLE